MRRPANAILGGLLASLAAIAVAAVLVWMRLADAPGEGAATGVATSGVPADAAQNRADAGPGFTPGVETGGAFTLTDHTGESYALSDLPTPYALIYFGYSYCPDVCPAELQDMSLALEEMAPARAEKITPLFVSVDPERDTPEVLAGYVGHFHERMVGLTGAPAEIADVAADYRVHYEKTGDTDGDDYLVDHTSYYYLVARDGTLQRMFMPKADIAALSEAVAAAVKADGPAS